MRTGLLVLTLLAMVAAPVAAQVAAPPPPDTTRTAPQTAATGLAPTGNLRSLLGEVEQAAVATNGDVARLRIEKWKADSSTKHDAEAMAQAVQRNLTEALPGMIAAVRAAPDNLAASFNLYRNLDTLYDVISSLSNMTGALGPKDDYEPLAHDTATLEQLRRNLADQIQQLASYKDNEVSRMMVQLRNAQAAAAAVPPTKIVVDDNPPAKKPVAKKKLPAKKKPVQPAAPTTPPGH